MRFRALVMGVLALGSVALAAKLAVLKETAPAYSQALRRVFDKPLFQVSKGEVVELVTTSSPLSRVRTRLGRTGWVETTKLDTVNRPPILSLLPADTAKAPATTAKEDSLIAKKWLAEHKTVERAQVQDSVAPSKPLLDSLGAKPDTAAAKAP